MRSKLFCIVALCTFIITACVLEDVLLDDRAEFEIKILSNRADLISGGDALVEVVIPDGFSAKDMRVTVNGDDVSDAFALREDGRYYGLIDTLQDGANKIVAEKKSKAQSKKGLSPVSVTIVNHPRGGPIFSGAQLEPWICARKAPADVVVTVPGTERSAVVTTRASGLDEDPYDEKCNAPTKRTFYYQPKTTENSDCTFTIEKEDSCFVPYDIDEPPLGTDIADFTNDTGDTVKSIVVFEQGTINRGMYNLAAFYDPRKPFTPWARQKGWNKKLLWTFGGGSGASRFQERPMSSVWIDDALKQGFMVAASSLTDHGYNCNDILAAETVMMVKELITETYGEIRYTIGQGGSGGAILQLSIASAYPGLLDGIRPSATFPDTVTTGIEVMDCGLLQNEYYIVEPGLQLSEEQKAAINGHPDTSFCAGWVRTFLPTNNATRAANCGAGFPEDLVFHPTERPDGIRCSNGEHLKGLLGTYEENGVEVARSVLDNEGVQYGLKALQDGIIDAEEFTALNENVGSYATDGSWTGPAAPDVPAPRLTARLCDLEATYSAGLISDGKQLAKTPIIDLRHNQSPGDIHMNWRAWAIRDRLDSAVGNHDNQLIWAFELTAREGVATDSLMLMDMWLENMAEDNGTPTLADVSASKPDSAADRCLSAPLTDVALDSDDCPVTYQSSPRQVAGGPLAENVLKCQLKPLDFDDPDYAGIMFTEDQMARLERTFPTGVCDWDKPGVGQTDAYGWATFENGPGGQPMGNL